MIYDNYLLEILIVRIVKVKYVPCNYHITMRCKHWSTVSLKDIGGSSFIVWILFVTQTSAVFLTRKVHFFILDVFPNIINVLVAIVITMLLRNHHFLRRLLNTCWDIVIVTIILIVSGTLFCLTGSIFFFTFLNVNAELWFIWDWLFVTWWILCSL